MGPFLGDEPHPEKSGFFLYVNTRKKSITLNLETKAGANILKELVKETDLLIENFQPRVMPSLGLGFKTLKEVNPHMVMVSITLFGQTGPYCNFKSTNLTSFAMGGQMMITGEPDREPLKNAGSQAEYQAGLYGFAAAAITSYGARMTGQGQHVDVSAMECMCSSIEGSLPTTSYIGDTHNRHRVGSRLSALMGIYPCRDGHVMVHANPREWPLVAQSIDIPELVDDERFITFIERRDHIEELTAIIMGWTTEHDKMEIYEKAAKMRTPWAPVLNTKELFESPQYKARGFFVEIEHPITGSLRYPGAPFRMSETPWQVERAPLLGEHNEEIYCKKLGYSRMELTRLKSQGVI